MKKIISAQSVIVPSYLKAHMKSHITEKSHKCSQCDKTFALARNLKSHMILHSGAKPYQCKSCDKTFGRASGLKNHEATHSDTRSYKCDQCDYAARDKGTLRQHLIRHSGEKAHNCSLCQFATYNSSQLKLHMKKHVQKSDEKQENLFKCSQCAFTTQYASYIKVHKKSHSGEKPNKCSHCGYATLQPSNLKQHMKTHMKEKHRMSNEKINQVLCKIWMENNKNELSSPTRREDEKELSSDKATPLRDQSFLKEKSGLGGGPAIGIGGPGVLNIAENILGSINNFLLGSNEQADEEMVSQILQPGLVRR